jgi:hypothetical protein
MAAGKNPFEEEERTQPAGAPGQSARALPKAGAASTSSTRLTPVAAPPPRPAERFASSFGDVAVKPGPALGRPQPQPAAAPGHPLTQAEVSAVAARFDGRRAAASAEVPAAQFKPLEVEATSQPGARQAVLTRAVLDQFAPETNSRYAVGECGHVFVWDFTRAMGCATPRWKAARELTAEQVCAWFRSLGTTDGWIRVASARAAELLKAGHPVIAMPKASGASLLAVGRPDEVDADGAPLLASACGLRRGNRLTTREAFGLRHADYFFHA